MTTIYRSQHVDQEALAGRPIAIIGFGSQGHAHALNLRDSGHDVRVGIRQDSRSWDAAHQAGLRVLSPADAAAEATLTMLLVPDTEARAVYNQSVRDTLTPGKALYFAHGFNIHFRFVSPPDDVDVTLVAPKSPGHRVRELYTEGAGVPGLIAIHRDATGHARRDALAYAHGIGCTRAGVIETSFAEETETDLFGEQAVLCGGVTALVQAGFDTLVEAGYQPEMAYFECLHELKLIVDLMYQGGMSYMRHSISDTAEFGDYTAGPRLINDDTRRTMRTLLQEIRNGEFAHRWMAEQERGGPSFRAARAQAKSHRIEQVGRELRGMMPFLDARVAPDPAITYAPAPERAVAGALA